MIQSIWLRGLRGKISTIIGCSVISILSLLAVSYFGEQTVLHSIEAITEIRMPSIKGLEAMNEGQTAVQLSIHRMQYNDGSQEQFREALVRYEQKKKQIEEGFKLYEPLPQSPDEAAEYNSTFLKAWKEWEEIAEAYVAAKKSGQEEEARKLYEREEHAFYPAESSLGKIISINYKNAEDDKQKALVASRNMSFLSAALGVLGAVFVISFSIFVASRTSNALSRLAVRLNDSSAEVASASNRIASSSQQLSQSTTEQSSSLEETASSLEQITSMISKAADGANSTSKRSNESREKAIEGKSAATDMLASIDEISKSNQAIMDQITKSNQRMTEIVAVIQNIGQKTKVINDIVFQTKLLSFNASVEAARAGEHGKGFAVVAEEVGNLAQMSGNAAKEITSMLDSSIKNVESIVDETKSSVEAIIAQGKRKVESGVVTAKRCAEILEEIVKNVTTVSELAQEISNASNEQSQGVAEINKAMGMLDTVTQQNAAASEDAARSAEELSNQAASLKQAVEELITTVEGRSDEKNPSRSIEIRNIRVESKPSPNVSGKEVPLKGHPGFKESA